MKNIMDTLRERGFIKQTVYEEDLYKKLGEESVPFYIGFDPTADSLHVGHFLQLMAMSWMQKAGHKPIILVGGGTGMIGDPSGRTDLRDVLTKETVCKNCDCFRTQMKKFLSFEGENAAIMVDNAEWLLGLNYVEFLREIGSQFSVNRMLTADCYKTRLERGLTFLEFNYMLMQAYDFLVLFRKFGCLLECGGDDQWSNILAGADLIRRKEGKDAFAMTFSLLTTSDGRKMGKTAKGAVWLDPRKTTPYEFYQYFRNIDDADVNMCLRLLTFLPMEEVTELTSHNDERINHAKEVLAWEVTKIVHGEEAANDAQSQARAAFSGDSENMPTITVDGSVLKIVDLLVVTKLAPSKGEAKRLIDGGAVKIGEEKVIGYDTEINSEDLCSGVIIHKGKKIHIRLIKG